MQSCFPCKLRHSFWCSNTNARKGYTKSKTKTRGGRSTQSSKVGGWGEGDKFLLLLLFVLFLNFYRRYILPPASFRAYSVLAGFAFLAQLSNIISIRPDYVLEGLVGVGQEQRHR